MPDDRKPIPPNPPRWKPNSDPASIEIPGLDTSASPHDQIEQIEQLITLKLQNIDENFSKIHHILSTKILPAVKRYAVGTEPVRDAAKFWVSFYEQAAQIRIPTYDDYSTVNEQPSEQRGSESDAQPSTSSTSVIQDQEQSVASTEHSFMPAQAAFSSTPATERVAHSLPTQHSEDGSWTTSVESPLVRLDRGIKSLSEEDADITAGPDSSKPLSQSDERTFDKGKGKEQPEPLLRNLLRHNLYTTNDSTPGSSVSPLRPRGKIKTPVPKELNPYLPPDTKPSNWSGIVNLQDPSVMTPQRFRHAKQPSSYRSRTITPAKQEEDDSDESFDGLPPGMSPPVLMSPARPPRSSAELGLLKLGQTPSKEAAARITRDLVSDLQKKKSSGSGLGKSSGKPVRGLFWQPESGTESSMSTVLTPPSLSRYGKDTSTSSGMATDSSLASMMRQVGLRGPIPQVGKVVPDTRPYEWSSAGESEQIAGPSSSSPPFQFHRPSQTQFHHLAPPVRAYGVVMDSFDDAVAGQLDMNNNEYATPVPHYQMPHEGLGLDPGGEVLEGDLEEDDSYYDNEVNNTAHPSAAFLMASQNRHPSDEDDSFDSVDQEGSSLDQDGFNLAPVHPFAQGVPVEEIYDDFDDDSYDANVGMGGGDHDGQSETLFGVPPGQREWLARGVGRQQELMLHGGDLLDTAELTDQIGKVEESPTPAGWNRNG